MGKLNSEPTQATYPNSRCYECRWKVTPLRQMCQIILVRVYMSILVSPCFILQYIRQKSNLRAHQRVMHGMGPNLAC